MRLAKRLSDLERRIDPAPPRQWVRIYQYEGQTQEQAIAAYEAENGPIEEKGVILRVIINKPFAPSVSA